MEANTKHRLSVTSNAMREHKISEISSDDLDELLEKVENSFDFKFGGNELMHIS